MRKTDNYIFSDDFYFHFLEASYFLKGNCCCKTSEISPVFADKFYGKKADNFYGRNMGSSYYKNSMFYNTTIFLGMAIATHTHTHTHTHTPYLKLQNRVQR